MSEVSQSFFLFMVTLFARLRVSSWNGGKVQVHQWRSDLAVGGEKTTLHLLASISKQLLSGEAVFILSAVASIPFNQQPIADSSELTPFS